MAGAASLAFKNKEFDIALLLTLVPVVKEYLHTQMKFLNQTPKADSTKEQNSNLPKLLVQFKKDSHSYLHEYSKFTTKTCLFFNNVSSEVIPTDVKTNIAKSGLAELIQNWGITQKQLANILTIKERLLADVDLEAIEENTVTLK